MAQRTRRIHVLLFILAALLMALGVDACYSERPVGLMDVVRPERSDALVIVKNPDDPAWHGRSGHAAMVLEKLIVMSREIGILHDGVLPVHLHVSASILDYGEAYRVLGRSFIVVGARRVRDGRVDGTLVHELAHLMTWGAHHESAWLGACTALLDEYYRREGVPPHERDMSNCFSR